ncbi:Uncharacterized NAD(P)/FAD-binding protein YdhS [Hymenobacter gelipurpurascens]|uniref:Uncharacterized NAD(P)/FAD-binding protein YdhS n=2 Tax=Hymenobacter gelipurpurascens TaxID=89968 RepID=A0A212U915_9BACT|nr:Uncharacterized NAD(P)/FAD-binding protein YdhS [Hymenobacter gelipurpurascens]
MLAVQLARLPATEPYACDVHLIEPRLVPGPGLAYTARRPEYLMNVPSELLSAFPDQPDHFLNWLRVTSPEQSKQTFCSRQSYGRYVQQLVGQVIEWPSFNGIRCHWHAQAATAVELSADGHSAKVRLADGTEILSDYVVLALGNFPPPSPAPAGEYLAQPTFHGNPWAQGALRNIGPDEPVLLVGSGLTAVDVLLGLQADGHRAPVTVVSRHGRWPAAHAVGGAPYPSFYATELAGLTSVAEVLQVVRRHAREAAETGTNWRAVIDSMRPDLGRIWAAWPPKEQARFLRHLAGIWSVIRHRSPPKNAALVQAMLTSGEVRMETGRVSRIQTDATGLLVTVQRLGQLPRTLFTAHVVNCTGPLLDYTRIQDPAVRSLRDAGLLCPDALRLGIQTDAHGALLTNQGQASSVLFTLGPSRRPTFFESTAVPELRQQAVALAEELGQRIRATESSVV